MYEYLRDNGTTAEEHATSSARPTCAIPAHGQRGRPAPANEHLLVEEDPKIFAGDIFSYYVVTRDYYDRYNLPVMETNHAEPDHGCWLRPAPAPRGAAVR